jgi:hypothetical protein
MFALKLVGSFDLIDPFERAGLPLDRLAVRRTAPPPAAPLPSIGVA